MRERVELLLGHSHARDVGDDVPRACARHPARRGAAAGLHAPVHDLRPGRQRGGWSSSCIDELGVDPKRFTPGAVQHQISDAKNKLRDAAAYRELVGVLLRADRRRRLRALRAASCTRMNAMDFDDLLVRTVNVLELFPEVRARYARDVPPRARRRVPGHEPRAVPAAAAARRASTATSRSSATTRSRSTASAAPTSATSSTSRTTSRTPTVVKLEQNYRSTQTILDAANAVIAHNRGQMHKTLWTDLGEGDPIVVRELDDEHAEARYVVGEIERLVDEGVSRAEIAIFYRTNAQSRVLEDTLVRARDRLPGHRRHEVLRARRDQGRDRLPDACSATRRTSSRFTRVANSPRARHRPDVALARARATPSTMGITRLGRGGRPGRGARPRRRGGQGARALHGDDDRAARARRARACRSATCSRRVLHETRLPRRAGGRAHDRGAGPAWRTSQELVEVAREFDAARRAGRATALDVFLQQVALVADADTRRDDDGPRDADDAAQRQGPRVPDRLHHRLRGGRLPALALDRRGLARGGAAPLLRRDHARDARPLRSPTRGAAASSASRDLRRCRSRFLGELPPDLARPRGLARRRLRRAARAAARRGRGRAWRSWAASTARRRGGRRGPSFRLGDDVVHAAFGEGVVTGVEPGGIVVVRFAGDGSRAQADGRVRADHAR